MLTASVAALPIFAKLLVDDRAEDTPPAIAKFHLEIIVGDVVNRADAHNRRLQGIRRAAQREAFGKRSESCRLTSSTRFWKMPDLPNPW